ncbi:class I SAM-dependent methyltransferase [Jatrophihabitans sp. YIM 134969]
MAGAGTSTAGESLPTGRGRLVLGLLTTLVTDLVRAGGAPRVLDCGGGTGALAVPLAVAGAHVTVVDRSVDALAILGRRATEAGVAARVEAVPGDLDQADLGLPGDSSGPFDLVLAHDVLTAVADPGATLRAAVARIAPEGALSLQVVNQAAVVLGRALQGDLRAAFAGLDAPTPGSYDVPALLELVAGLGLVADRVHGVGVLTEYVAGPDLEAHGVGAPDLAALEARLAARSPYRDVASRVHVLARRTAV